MNITSQSFVPEKLISTYSQIDALRVIKELLKFKGSEIVSASKQVRFKALEDVALIVYGLKSNSTNRLFVGHHLSKAYRKAGLLEGRDLVTVPNDILSDAMEEEITFRK